MLAKSEAKSSPRTSSRGQKQQTSPVKPSKRSRMEDKLAESKVAKLRVAQSSVAGSQKDDPASPDNNITSSSTSSPEPNTQVNTRTTTRSNSLDYSSNDVPSQTQEDPPPPRRTSARRRATVQQTTTTITSTTPSTRESPDSDNESENHPASDDEDAQEDDANSDKDLNKKSSKTKSKRTYTSETMEQRFENLDQQQVQIRDGSHPQYIRLLEDIESKRSEKYGNALIRRKLAQSAITACFEADKKQANDQFYFGRVSIRRDMLDHVQKKISALHAEYITLKFGQDYSLEKSRLFANWVPPERPTMINILFIIAFALSFLFGAGEGASKNKGKRFLSLFSKCFPLAGKGTGKFYIFFFYFFLNGRDLSLCLCDRGTENEMSLTHFPFLACLRSLTPGLQEDEIEQDLEYARHTIDFEHEDDEDGNDEEEGRESEIEIDHEREQQYEDQVLFPDTKENEESDHEAMIESHEDPYRPSEYSEERASMANQSQYESQLPDHRKPTFRYIPRPLAPLPPPNMAHHEHEPVPLLRGTFSPRMAAQRPLTLTNMPASHDAATAAMDKMNGKNVLARKAPVNIAPAWARPPPLPQPSGRIDFDLSGPDSPPLETLASLADEQYRQYYSKRSFIVQERIKDYTGSKKKKKKGRHSKKAKRSDADRTTRDKGSTSKDVLVS